MLQEAGIHGSDDLVDIAVERKRITHIAIIVGIGHGHSEVVVTVTGLIKGKGSEVRPHQLDECRDFLVPLGFPLIWLVGFVWILLAHDTEVQMLKIAELSDQWAKVAVHRPCVPEEGPSCLLFCFWRVWEAHNHIHGLTISALVKCLQIIELHIYQLRWVRHYCSEDSV